MLKTILQMTFRIKKKPKKQRQQQKKKRKSNLTFYHHKIKYIVKPVYKGHSREPQMWPLWAVALYIQVKIINGKNETAIYRQWFVIEVQAGLTVFYKFEIGNTHVNSMFVWVS